MPLIVVFDWVQSFSAWCVYTDQSDVLGDYLHYQLVPIILSCIYHDVRVCLDRPIGCDIAESAYEFALIDVTSNFRRGNRDV